MESSNVGDYHPSDPHAHRWKKKREEQRLKDGMTAGMEGPPGGNGTNEASPSQERQGSGNHYSPSASPLPTEALSQAERPSNQGAQWATPTPTIVNQNLASNQLGQQVAAHNRQPPLSAMDEGGDVMQMLPSFTNNNNPAQFAPPFGPYPSQMPSVMEPLEQGSSSPPDRWKEAEIENNGGVPLAAPNPQVEEIYKEAEKYRRKSAALSRQWKAKSFDHQKVRGDLQEAQSALEGLERKDQESFLTVKHNIEGLLHEAHTAQAECERLQQVVGNLEILCAERTVDIEELQKRLQAAYRDRNEKVSRLESFMSQTQGEAAQLERRMATMDMELEALAREKEELIRMQSYAP